MSTTAWQPTLMTLAMAIAVAGPAHAQSGSDDFAGDGSTTGSVAVGGTANGALDSGNDVDWFAVEFLPNRTYTIDLEGAPTGAGTLPDPLLVLYDSNEIQVARDDDGGESFNARLLFTPRDGGTHYLAVEAFGQATGTYRLSVVEGGEAPAERPALATPQPQPVQGPPLPEPTPQAPVLFDDFAGDASTTGRATVGGRATGSLESAGDTDWFAASLRGGVAYVIDLEGAPTGQGSLVDPLLTLHDAGGNEIQRDDDGGTDFNSRLVFTPPWDATFFLSAQAFGQATGTYTLTVAEQVGPPAPAPQPGPSRPAGGDVPGDRSTTVQLRLGQPTTSALDFPGDEDWFAVQLQAGPAYTIDLQGRPTNQGTLDDPLVRLQDPNGNVIGQDDDGGQGLNAALTIQPAFTGTYHVVARAFGDATGTYTLTVNDRGFVSDDFADNPGTTGQLALGRSVAGTLELNGDVDWFGITLQARVPYTFDLEGQPTGQGSLSDPLLSIHDSSGRELARDDDGGSGFNSRLSFSPPRNATYFLAAQAFGSETGTYRLSATQGAAFSDDFSSNTGTSGFLPIGGSARGTLEVAGDQDWFAVQLNGGTAYAISMEGSSTNQGTLSDPKVAILDANGRELAVDDDGGQSLNALLQFVAPRPGTYYVNAHAFGSETGSYVVTVTQGSRVGGPGK